MAQTFDPGQLKVSLAAKLRAAADEGPFGAEAKRRGFTSGPDLWSIAGSSIVDAIIAIVEHGRRGMSDKIEAATEVLRQSVAAAYADGSLVNFSCRFLFNDRPGGPSRVLEITVREARLRMPQANKGMRPQQKGDPDEPDV